MKLKKCNRKCNNEKKVLEKKVLEKKNGVEKLKVFNNIKSSFQYFIFLYIFLPGPLYILITSVNI